MAALATFIQQVINGLMLGGGYALVAIGYTLIFGVLNLLHLAHGEVAMIGSYVGLTLVLIAMSQVGVLPLSPRQWLEVYTETGRPAFLSHLARDQEGAGGARRRESAFRKMLMSAPSGRRTLRTA